MGCTLWAAAKHIHIMCCFACKDNRMKECTGILHFLYIHGRQVHLSNFHHLKEVAVQVKIGDNKVGQPVHFLETVEVNAQATSALLTDSTRCSLVRPTPGYSLALWVGTVYALWVRADPNHAFLASHAIFCFKGQQPTVGIRSNV